MTAVPRRPGDGLLDRPRATPHHPLSLGIGAAAVSCRGSPIALPVMRDRLCSKVACAREAVTTLTFDYADQMAAIGPLGSGGDPHAHDLCAIHTDRLSVPRGWVVVRHETLRL